MIPGIADLSIPFPVIQCRHMSSRVASRPRQVQALAWARAVVALSLLLGFLPRVLDHHWVERVPWHAHLTVGGERGHRHSFEATHDHDGSGASSAGVNLSGQVVITYHDGGTTSALALTLPILTDGPTWPGYSLERLTSTSGGAGATGVVPGVPHPPPIVALPPPAG